MQALWQRRQPPVHPGMALFGELQTDRARSGPAWHLKVLLLPHDKLTREPFATCGNIAVRKKQQARADEVALPLDFREETQ